MRQDLGRQIWIYTIAIVVIGLIALYSAAYENVRVPQSIFFDQLICVCFGFGIMYVLAKVSYRKFYDIAYLFYVFNIVLLILVLVKGHLALGAQRWIALGPIKFQPSELTKLSVILMLGRYFTKRGHRFFFGFYNKIQILVRDLFIPFFLTALPMYLIYKQPDLGTSLLFLGIFFAMLFVSGLRYQYIIGFLLVCISIVPFGWHFLKAYQKDRLLVFLNPNMDPLGAGYTIIQSKIAVGSGQVMGKGWLAGTQNQLNFLPERHTDFIFSVIGEEWGLIGGLVLIYCYFMLIQYSLKIAEQIKDQFGELVVTGIVSILALQVIINIGMVIGAFPIVGLTLPLISYGRSSLLIFFVMMGFLLNLSGRHTIF